MTSPCSTEPEHTLQSDIQVCISGKQDDHMKGGHPTLTVVQSLALLHRGSSYDAVQPKRQHKQPAVKNQVTLRACGVAGTPVRKDPADSCAKMAATFSSPAASCSSCTCTCIHPQTSSLPPMAFCTGTKGVEWQCQRLSAVETLINPQFLRTIILLQSQRVSFPLSTWQHPMAAPSMTNASRKANITAHQTSS